MMNISDLLGLRTPRGTSLVNPSRQLAPPPNGGNSMLESSIMNLADKSDRKGLVYEVCT